MNMKESCLSAAQGLTKLSSLVGDINADASDKSLTLYLDALDLVVVSTKNLYDHLCMIRREVSNEILRREVSLDS